MQKPSRPLVAIATAVGALVALTGCTQEAEAGPVTIEYLGWVTGLETSVDLWNSENPDIQVELTTTTGASEADPAIRTGVQAGNAPCMSQMAYYSIPNFVADDLLLPITDEAAPYEDDFLDWTWSASSAGGEVYGIPQDTGPMVMYYNQVQFDEFGITMPTTWDEYAAAAASVHTQDPTVTLGFLGTDDVGNYAGYVAQAGGNWTSIEGNEWKVGINDEAAVEVADFWQGLIDRGEAAVIPRFDPGIYPLFNDGKLLTMIGASWNYNALPSNVPGQSGQWRVAPMPTWDEPSSANSGGSASVVLKGCEHPAEAAQFAAWLNSSEESMATLAAPDGGGLYPAAIEAFDYDVVNSPVEYYGGQNVYEEFAASAALVDTSWTFGPTYAGTSTAYSDGFAEVTTGQKTLAEVADDVQASTVEEMTQRGIAASGR